MRSRRIRRFIVALLVLSGVGAAASTWNLQRRVTELTRAEQALDGRLDRMAAAVAETALAQAAYVAPGQPDETWFTRVSTLVQQLSEDIASIAAGARSAETRGILQSGSEALAALVQLDTELRENVRLGEDLIAADRIFGEAPRWLEAIATPLRGVRDAERAAFGAARADLLRETRITVGAVTVLWLIGLAWLARSPVPSAIVGTLASPAPPIADALTPLESPGQARTPVDLGAAADICVAMARVTSSIELPELLGRVAAVLDASGVIIWIGAGEELYAVAAHGYEPRVIERLGSIGRNADNATAAAWRRGEVTIVPADIISDGAIVAPMLGPDGCLGVLAAEIRHGRESDADTRAVIVMIAAQLGTLVAGWPSAATVPGTVPTETAAHS
jgi:hypothetical protein